MMERKVHGFCVAEPSVSASCGPDDEEMVSAKRGDVVPIPITPALDKRAISFEPEPFHKRNLRSTAEAAFVLKTFMAAALFAPSTPRPIDGPAPVEADTFPTTLNLLSGAPVPIPTNPDVVSALNTGIVVVVNVDALDVARKKLPEIALNAQLSVPANPSDSASCAAVDVAR